ncbi:induced myeloid leukemia cell differentiation protein Mcl-1b isoform X1 [Anarrhichthys ocellatus]|uniref:induced myeloid leukemia cell differentiation protein Mcl-1b isoform X1 n=1 Tax=Anarrhichthys ocellatus TaxID=433405 RepID=UPI0012EE18F4|nr:induced myeloid leukemia cell differentiation protein Mcl-1 homolog isoform X1 [Anarrhichthys ocellatus]
MNIIPTTKRAAFNVTGVMSCFIQPQNGVAEGAMRYGSGESTPQIAMGSGKDSHSNGNVVGSSNDTPKRPKMLLGMDYATAKALREDSQGIDDDSLPCTPDADGDEHDVSGYSAVLENDTRQLISRFLEEFTGLSKSQWNEGRELKTMKRVVEDVLEKHRYAFNGMINKLSLDDRSDDTSFVRLVAKSLFADGTTNWGRIASLVAFGAVVCQYLKEKGRGNCVELVGQEISTYLLSDQRDWLVKNNAWDGFVEFFRVADPESTVRNTLMAVAGFAGIGATLALLISRCAVM